MQADLSEQSPIRPTVCLHCMRPMHFVTSPRNKELSIQSHLIFACECGRTSEQITLLLNP
jgi:hypothetical protein